MKELLFKVLIIGDFGVGKTAVIRRYTEGVFSPHYKLTIGVDFAVKALVWDNHTKINLQLWDIAGHERFGYLTRVYYKYAMAAVIVYDLSRPATFQSIAKWYADVKEKVTLKDGRPIPVLLIANKCDIPNADIDMSMLTRYCDENKFLGWYYTSAKDNINVDEAFQFLLQNILGITAEIDTCPAYWVRRSQTNGTIHLDSMELEKENGKRKKICCSS